MNAPACRCRSAAAVALYLSREELSLLSLALAFFEREMAEGARLGASTEGAVHFGASAAGASFLRERIELQQLHSVAGHHHEPHRPCDCRTCTAR